MSFTEQSRIQDFQGAVIADNSVLVAISTRFAGPDTATVNRHVLDSRRFSFFDRLRPRTIK